MECFPDTVDHAEDRQRHLNRDGSRAGGLAGRLPPVMLRRGWQSPFFCTPCPTTIREGLAETLTVQRLGLDGGAPAYAADDEHHREPQRQRRALLAQRHKRWRGGHQMIQRWVASALVEAEKCCRRSPGATVIMQHLVGALDALAPARPHGC